MYKVEKTKINRKVMKKYQVTKKFISGLLKGLTYTEITSVKFNLGEKYGNYIIIDVQEV